MTSEDAIIEQCSALHDLKRWDEIVALSQKGLATYPENSDLWEWLGQGLYQLDRDQEAIKAMRAACHLNPNSSWAFSQLSRFLQTNDQIPEAIRAAETAAALNPHDKGIVIRLARLARETGDKDKAWELSYKARDMAPNDRWVWVNLCWQAERDHRWQDAYDYNNKVMEIAPNDGARHRKMAKLLKDLDRRDEAKEALRRSMVIDPSDEWTVRELIKMLFEDGEEERAFSTLRGAVTAFSSNNNFIYMLADKLLQYDRVDEAAEAATTGTTANTPDADMWCMLARVNERRGQYELAVDNYRKAVEIAPTSSYANRMLASALADVHEYPEAIKVGKRAVDLESGGLWNHVFYAQCLRQSGAIDDAILYLQGIIESHPAVGFLRSALAASQAAKGEFAGAMQSMRETLERRPKILRYWHIAFRIAGLANDKKESARLRKAFAKLPEETSRFGKRLLQEAELQADAFSAIADDRWQRAEELVVRGLADACRRDDYACTLVCLMARIYAARGEVDAASALLGGESTGPHHTTVCNDAHCPDKAAVRDAL